MENLRPTVAAQPSVSAIALRYGLIVGLISVVYTLTLFLAGLNTTSVWGWLSYIILIAGIFIAHQQFKSENGGFMSYGQGLGIGTLIGAVTGVLSAIFIYIYVRFVDSDFVEKIREAQVVELERRNLNDEQIERALAMSESFTGPGMMAVTTVIGSIILAFLFSLVIAAITRNSRPDFE